MLEVCGVCGSLYEVVDEDDEMRGCPECEERRQKAEARSRRLEAIKKNIGYLVDQLQLRDTEVQERVERALELPLPYKRDDSHYGVLSSQGDQYYEVDLLNLRCTCQDYLIRKAKSNGNIPFPCKHQLRVGILLAEEEARLESPVCPILDEREEEIKEHSQEARAKIESNHKEVYAKSGFYG